jgi:hypothetical protein
MFYQADVFSLLAPNGFVLLEWENNKNIPALERVLYALGKLTRYFLTNLQPFPPKPPPSSIRSLEMK